MMGQNQVGNLNQFEAFFKRADLDQDGRISGTEAVAFFQGSGLSKQVLAQIWMHADQNRNGFLGRQEFYNALKLVTVAQSKRELTPEIVRSALHGPASSKIPPPQINLPPSPTPQPPSMSSSSAMPVGGMMPTPSTNFNRVGPSQGLVPGGPIQTGLFSSGTPNPGRPNLGVSPGFSSSGIPTPPLQNAAMSVPHIPSSGISPSVVPSSMTSTPSNNTSTNWMGGNMSGAPYGQVSQVTNKSMPTNSLNTLMPSQTPNTNISQVLNKGTPSNSLNTLVPTQAPNTNFSSNSSAESDPFAAFSMTKSSATPATSLSTSSAIVPVSSVTVTQPPLRTNSLDSLNIAYIQQPLPSHSNVSPSAVQAPSSGVSPGLSVGPANNGLEPSQPPWPKMTTPGIQKYTKVFMEVDTDRDGKITGDQARNLFLSWKLPREVLKQVWDLADQDNDSMLSLREFCIALYLMERYREGRSLPASLPNSLMLDETLMRVAGPPNSSHGYRSVHGVPGPQVVSPASGLRPVMQPTTQNDLGVQVQPTKSRTLDVSQANQHNDGEKNFLQPSPPDANGVENKAEKVEKVILDSREKLEYYRTKMQELVLYKSRCDNRLNEIIERASADKREADMLGKKYEEKYKQVQELNSKLTIEEAKFREYQERKTELQQAIINMEQGGSADGMLQVRADRIQSDFEVLLQALAERCNVHGIEIKSAAMIELPKGWQPGIQEGAAVWDEEWDKFDDEGLLFDKEVSADGQTTKASPKSTLFENGTYSHDELYSPDSSSNFDGEKQFSRGERALDSEYGYTHSEDDSARSPTHGPTTLESSSQDFSDIFAKSEVDSEFNRGFDDQGWGNFDGNDDADSVWGFNSKDQHGDNLFESGGFGLSPRTDSPQGNNNYNKRSPFNFADSVPGTPSYSKSGNSPRYSEAGDNFFDNYSRFDSFSMNESTRFSPPRETLTRFDSISSSRSGFGGHTRGFTSFDDADPFGSTGPFKVSSDTHKKSSDNWSSF